MLDDNQNKHGGATRANCQTSRVIFLAFQDMQCPLYVLFLIVHIMLVETRQRVFFIIPSIIQNGDERDEKLSTRRRAPWLRNVSRQDLTEEQAKYTRVCSDHLLSGEG